MCAGGSADSAQVIKVDPIQKIGLGAIGFLRIVMWQMVKPVYGPHYLLIATTVFGSLVGVVTFVLEGTLLSPSAGAGAVPRRSCRMPRTRRR